jgi:NAD+ diphosphatase
MSPSSEAHSARNGFTALALNRCTAERRDAAWVAERLADPATRFVPVFGAQSLVAERPHPHALLLDAEESAPLQSRARATVFLGEGEGHAYFALALAPEEAAGTPFEADLRDLRRIASLLAHGEAALLAYARAMAYWHDQHRYCGHCGSPTESREGGHLRVCTRAKCGTHHFPRTDPAVIVLVSHGGRALLGRQRLWPPTLYSTIAGFVEPGESLEDAVIREVREETGVEVEAVTYRSSQPWPFPSSLMLGFRARARSTEICCGDGELEDARWFSRRALQAAIEAHTLRLPSPVSIAYQLIRTWYDEG